MPDIFYTSQLLCSCYSARQRLHCLALAVKNKEVMTLEIFYHHLLQVVSRLFFKVLIYVYFCTRMRSKRSHFGINKSEHAHWKKSKHKHDKSRLVIGLKMLLKCVILPCYLNSTRKFVTFSRHLYILV